MMFIKTKEIKPYIYILDPYVLRHITLGLKSKKHK